MRNPGGGEAHVCAPRVLVVDDQEMIRLLAARVLRDGGWAVETAGEIAEALALRPLGFDVLVVDLRLGAERGTDLLAALHAQDPAVPHRCLVLTGATVDPIPDDVAVLVKPFRAEDLLDAVNRLGNRVGDRLGDGLGDRLGDQLPVDGGTAQGRRR